MKRTLFYDLPVKVKRPTLRQYEQWLKRNRRLTPAVAEALAKAKKIKKLKVAVVYIAGKLTDVTSEEKARYTRASTIIEAFGMFGYAPHLHGTDPKTHSHVTPAEVRDIDYLWAVVMADFHINFLFPIAHGNAIEAGWAEAFGIPMIYCAVVDISLSRLTKGLLTIDRTFLHVTLYTVYENLKVFFQEFTAWQKRNKSKKVVEFFVERKLEERKKITLLQTAHA